MSFVTYENHQNRHVTIHLAGCHQIGKRGGQHKYGQGGYHSYSSYSQAYQYADSTKLPLILCSSCMKINGFFQNVLGANLKNQRWSWGAVDPLNNRVFLRVWKDQIQPFESGKRVIVARKISRRKSEPGLTERRNHLELIRQGAKGIGIVCESVDPDTSGARKIKSFDGSLLLQLGRFTDDDDRIYAQIEAYLPISQLDRAQTAQSTLAKDIKAIMSNRDIDSTVKETLVNARIGQGKFRADVLQLWENRCAVTGSSILDAIRASHIKPWRFSDNQERLDPNNGLPLVANLDALFDVGLISFDRFGTMLISPKLTDLERGIYDLVGKTLARKPSLETAEYLAHHQNRFFPEPS